MNGQDGGGLRIPTLIFGAGRDMPLIRMPARLPVLDVSCTRSDRRGNVHFWNTATDRAVERRTARGGKDSIDHAPMAHDDVANAAAGVFVMVKTGRQPMQFSAEALARL